MIDEEMQELVKRAAVIVGRACNMDVFKYNDAVASPLVAAVFSALVAENQPAWSK